MAEKAAAQRVVHVSTITEEHTMLAPHVMSNEAPPDSKQVEQLHARLVQYMEKHKLRSTGQRRLVTDVFFRTGGHQSIEELLAMVREEDPKVGYATVYRTLKLLTESGIANEHHFGDGFTRYEIALKGDHHDHLICTACGTIVEFEQDRIEELQDQVAKKHGFILSSHKHELYGLCPNCQN